MLPASHSGAGRPGLARTPRRMAAVTLIVAGTLLGSGSGVAQAAAVVDTSPVSFEVTSTVCANLPAGTTVTGSGIETSVTSMPARPGGFLVNSTHATGTATDQDGNRYVFSYSNEFRVTTTEDGSYVGLMTDHFSLSGSGPATLSNGFVAHLRTDFSTFFSLDPISARGDPISFPDGAAICDPL
jgi:hypothetical protein